MTQELKQKLAVSCFTKTDITLTSKEVEMILKDLEKTNLAKSDPNAANVAMPCRMCRLI